MTRLGQHYLRKDPSHDLLSFLHPLTRPSAVTVERLEQAPPARSPRHPKKALRRPSDSPGEPVKKKRNKRKRGTASIPCPHCKADTQVLRTTRVKRRVIRERRCTGDPRHRFETTESITSRPRKKTT